MCIHACNVKVHLMCYSMKVKGYGSTWSSGNRVNVPNCTLHTCLTVHNIFQEIVIII